ncbi:MAG: folate-binding protein [Alphaproteobacteria bacterium]|nr:MAG: folate-binding protein [Alphaproteobacteria bacterium]
MTSPAPTAARGDGRTVLAVTGQDRERFLQGLVTNDVGKLADGPVYAALLTPQGKYLADFILLADGERILLDVATSLADTLVQRLEMYRLRADVAIRPTDLGVLRGTGTPPEGAVADPRHPALGWRLYTDAPASAGSAEAVDWDAIRVEHAIPETGIELQPGVSYILEMGFERLNGVDFRKGCYVGQEVTARMKHKTELRKGLARVEIDGRVPVATPIYFGGRVVGQVFTQSGNRAIAYLRYDLAGPTMQAEDAVLRWDGNRP